MLVFEGLRNFYYGNSRTLAGGKLQRGVFLQQSFLKTRYPDIYNRNL